MSGKAEPDFESVQEDPFLSAPMRGPMEGRLEELKERLLRPVVANAGNADLAKDLSWAANEAAALAWLTVCPTLLFPALLEEKVQAVLLQREKQEQVRHR
jgi:hypothetical protein